MLFATTVLNSSRGFPQEIADSLGWGGIYEDLGVEEEGHLGWFLSSPIPPYHVLRMKKLKILRQHMFFWEKKAAIDIESLNAIFAGSFKESAEILPNRSI